MRKNDNLNMAGGDFGEGGVGTNMAEKTREISRKLGEWDSIKSKTTGKTACRERREVRVTCVSETHLFYKFIKLLWVFYKV